jgi:hypothetical protein
VWGVRLESAKQQNLIITRENEPEITVDNIQVAQFVYLLLHNPKIRDVIDTIGKTGVLLLGRFTEGRIVASNSSSSLDTATLDSSGLQRCY